MPIELLEMSYSNVQSKDVVSDAEALLGLGLTAIGPTSLTFLEESHGTLDDFLQSELVGIWRGRTDISNTLEYAKRLRAAAERRHGNGRGNRPSS